MLLTYYCTCFRPLFSSQATRWRTTSTSAENGSVSKRGRLSLGAWRKKRRERSEHHSEITKELPHEKADAGREHKADSPVEPVAPPPPPSRIGWLWKYGLLAAGIAAAYYVISEANDNPSFWYNSSVKAPYVITPSGRKLAYSEYGNPLGKDVVFVFHDYLAGRTEVESLGLDKMLKEEKRWANVRVIVVDRPGYGQSDAQRHRRLADWPEDVMRVVTALKIDKFSIIGIGAGGLYALACAETIPAAQPGRLVNVALLATEAPRHDHFGMPIPTTAADQSREWRIQQMLARRFGAHGTAINMGFYPTSANGHQAPPVKLNDANVATSYMGSLAIDAILRLSNVLLYSTSNPEYVFELVYGNETKVLAARPELYKSVVHGAREALSQGFHSVQDELAVTKDRGATSAIGYSHLQLAKGAHIEMWHGDRDQLVPLPMAAHLAKLIPSASLHICRGQGHLTSIINNWNAALDFVTTPPPAELEEIQDNLKAEVSGLMEAKHAYKESRTKAEPQEQADHTLASAIMKPRMSSEEVNVSL